MVVCVVLNWNGWKDTIACLRTLAEQTYQPLHVIVVDNGSTDESTAELGAWIDGAASGSITFRLLPSAENLGYARGVNLGIREALQAGAEFVWLLNNDTECPPDTLSKLVRTAGAKPHTGIVATVLLYHSDPATVQAWGGGEISRLWGTTKHYLKPAPLVHDSYATFASVLIRADVFREIGLLNEQYFMYYEDSDFCLRMATTWWKMAVAADTAVLHKENGSREETRHPFIEKTIAVSGMRFLERYSPLPWLSIPVFVLLKVVNRIRLFEWKACLAVLSGVSEYRRL